MYWILVQDLKYRAFISTTTTSTEKEEAIEELEQLRKDFNAPDYELHHYM